MEKQYYDNRIENIQRNYFGNYYNPTAVADREFLEKYYYEVGDILCDNKLTIAEKADWFREQMLTCYENSK